MANGKVRLSDLSRSMANQIFAERSVPKLGVPERRDKFLDVPRIHNERHPRAARWVAYLQAQGIRSPPNRWEHSMARKEVAQKLLVKRHQINQPHTYGSARKPGFPRKPASCGSAIGVNARQKVRPP